MSLVVNMANKKISNEELKWLRKHRQNVEKAKTISIYTIFILFGLAMAALLVYASSVLNPLVSGVAFVGIIFGGILSMLYDEDKGSFVYNVHKVSLVFLAYILAIIISGILAGIAFAPLASISQYPISMQVFYPNHPNITITQNCTDFTTSASGYFNGQPINPTNTTQCTTSEAHYCHQLCL